MRSSEEARVDDHLDTRGSRRHALLARLLQALIELAPPASGERSNMESPPDHVAARGGLSALRQVGLEFGDAS